MLVSRKKRNLYVFLMTIASVLLGLSSCGKTSSSVKDTLSIAMSSDAKTFDIHAANDVYSHHVNNLIYNALLYYNEDTKQIEPRLAESFRKIDSITYEFKIRKGVKFHNGETMTIQDVHFTFQRAMGPDGAVIAAQTDKIDPKGFKIVDDNTYIIKLKAPYPDILQILSANNFDILNEKAVKSAGKDYGQNPVGTGPYKFVLWQRASKIEVTRFDEYWGPKPKIKTIIIRPIVEPTNRVIELESGGVDIAYDISTNDIKRLQENKDIVLQRTLDYSVAYMGFNCKKKPFDDVRVRQAFAYAIDIAQVQKTAWRGVGGVPKGMLTTTLKYSNPQMKTHEYNPEKAKQLLKEAGYPNGFKAESWTNDRKERIDMAQIMQAMLKNVGIEIEIKVFEWGTYFDKTAKGEHTMYQMGWTSSTSANVFDPLFHSKNKGAAGNRAFYSNPEMDKTIEALNKLDDGPEKEKLFYRAQDIAMQDLPYMPTFFGEQVCGVRKNVKGFKISPSSIHETYGTYFEETK